MSNTNDIFQVDYLPDEKKIKINLPEEVWRNIDAVIMTRLFQEELVVEKQKEIEVEEGGRVMKIKFRVWDKRNNRMIKPKNSATVIPVLDFNGNLGIMDTYKNWHWHGIVPEDEYELMLFIGSHDKNGKEIYEADIVLYDRNIHKDIDTAKFKVVWVKDRYVLQEIKHKYYIDDVIWELVEVIGNIYEAGH